MEAMFGPSSFLLDPTSHLDESTSFLSFSSFADLDINSPSWNIFGSNSSSKASNASDTSSPAPLDPFQIISSAFEPASPAGDIGIFHTPAKAGPSKYSSSESSVHTISHRSSTSSGGWNTPLTPSLTNKSSVDSFQSFPTGADLYLPPPHAAPFSWDDAPTILASSSYEPVTPRSAPHKTTSNPTLGPTRSRPPIKPIASMPALKEEDHVASTPSQWFDGTEILDASSSSQPADVPLDVGDDVLADDFDWVFGDYGLGEAVPTDSAIFAAFHTDHPTPADENQSHVIEHQPAPDMSWLPDPSLQDLSGMGDFDFSHSSFTIDPMAVMAPNGVEDEPSRPSSAPGLNGGELSGQMLSVPLADMMTRSVSSDSYPHVRHAPPRDLFSYAPQQYAPGPHLPQPLYTSDPSPSYNPNGPSPFQRGMPLTTRRSSNQLSIQINPPQFSTFLPSALPPTPQSATFGDMSQGQPIQMTRAGTQPVSMSRKVSDMDPITMIGSSAMPAHLLRAQAIVQMQEAKEEAQRLELRRLSSARRVGMAEASIMQPQSQNRQRQTIMGWEGPSSQSTTLPVLTTTPLVTVHPPPAQYYLGSAPPTPHRVHPPPHPGSSRPVARLPSPTKRRTSTSSPSKTRSPSSKRKPAPSGGAFSWGETTFINFTPDDADKLLTGVAPSGCQSKRKREEDAVSQVNGEVDVFGDPDRERSKRSRSDE